jgi:hypothetical protein
MWIMFSEQERTVVYLSRGCRAPRRMSRRYTPDPSNHVRHQRSLLSHADVADADPCVGGQWGLHTRGKTVQIADPRS